jgi:hypothetical protein
VKRTPAGRIVDHGEDVVSFSITGGSNNHQFYISLGTWRALNNLGDFGPVDERAKLIWRAIQGAAKL